MNIMNDDNVVEIKKILLLVDLKEDENLEDLNDPHLLRTIGAFYSKYGQDIPVISLRKLIEFSQSHQNPVNYQNVYIVGHGIFSSLGSGLGVEECGDLFKNSLSQSNFSIDHIHLTVCHSAEKNPNNDENKSLLFAVHEKLYDKNGKPIHITGYKNQIHLIRTESLTCGHFKLDDEMPYASIIHEGLQGLRALNDCKTLTNPMFEDLMYFSNYYLKGTKPPEKTGSLYKMLDDFATALQSRGIEKEYYDLIKPTYDSIENLGSRLSDIQLKYNIETEPKPILTEEIKNLNLDELILKYKELKSKKDDIDSEEFKQVYWAFETYKSTQVSLINDVDFFKQQNKKLSNELQSYFEDKLVDKNIKTINKICSQVTNCAKNIYFNKHAMDLQEKTDFIKVSDMLTIRDSTDTLNSHNYYLINPEHTYTCKTNNVFPEFKMFGPTIDWDKGFWREILENLENLKYEEINKSFKYITEAFLDFKTNNDIFLIKELLSELSIRLLDFSKNLGKGDMRELNLYFIMDNLINEKNSEILQQLDKDALINWNTLLENLPKRSRAYEDKRQKALQVINNCMKQEDLLNTSPNDISIDTTKDNNLNKSTQNILSNLTQNNVSSNNVKTNTSQDQNTPPSYRVPPITRVSNIQPRNGMQPPPPNNIPPPPPNRMPLHPSRHQLRMSEVVPKKSETPPPQQITNKKNNN